MAEGLKTALKEILSREVVGEETKGEVTAWNPGTSKEKPEQNLIATFSPSASSVQEICETKHCPL